MGMDSNGNPKAIDPEKRKAFFSQITPYIKDIPSELEKAMLSEQNLSQLMSLINKETLKIFAIDGDTKQWGVLDDKKITPENVKQFANSINSILEEVNSKVAVLQVEQTVQEVLQNIKKEIDIPDKQKEKITYQISQALTKLDPDDLRNNKGDIISEVTKDIVKRKTLGSSLTKELTISTESLQNISNQLIEKHGKKSEPLTKAASIISSEKISEGRPEKKINTEISLPIISKAIDAVLKEKNAKIKPEQLAEIKNKLLPALSDLDPEYLKSHKNSLTKELTNHLANKGNTSLWNKNFTIDSSKLEKLSMEVKRVEERKSNKFVEEKIKLSISSHVMPNSVLTTKLSEFLAENNAEIKLKPDDIKSITNQQLVELRKINPESFDKTLFPTTEPKPIIKRLPAYNKGIKPSATPALPVKKKGSNIVR